MTGAILSLLIAAAPATADDVEDYRSHVDQAKLFTRKKWWRDAAEELEAAVASPDGRLDAEAWLLLAQVRLELCDATGAADAANRAHSAATSDLQAEQAARLTAALTHRFGTVTVDGPHPGLTARISVELTTPLFDGELKRYVRGLESCYAEPVSLPIELSLPAGGYRINGASIEMTPNGLSSLNLRSDQLEQNVIKQTFQLTHANVGLGMTAWMGPAARNMLPGPTVRVAVSQPAGPLVVTVAGDWSGTPYGTTDGGLSFAALGWGATLQLGGFIPGVSPLVMRLSAGYRLGSTGGIERTCENIAVSTEPSQWVCPSEQQPELVTYLYGLTHEPHAEVSVDYLGDDWTRGVGFGVSMSAGYAFGFLPATSTAADHAGDLLDLSITPDAQTWQAATLRLILHTTFAF